MMTFRCRTWTISNARHLSPPAACPPALRVQLKKERMNRSGAKTKRSRRGFTLLEVVLATLLLALVAVGVATTIAFINKATLPLGVEACSVRFA